MSRCAGMGDMNGSPTASISECDYRCFIMKKVAEEIHVCVRAYRGVRGDGALLLAPIS